MHYGRREQLNVLSLSKRARTAKTENMKSVLTPAIILFERDGEVMIW